MTPAQWAVALSILLFFAMVACLEAGYRLGGRRSKDPDLAHEGVGAVEAAVFALLGLLLGFSFAGGTSRFEAYRQLVVQEANVIGTAYLRVDLLAPGDQSEMRELFRQYLDARLRVYRALPDLGAAGQEFARATQLQQRIWSLAVTASRADPSRTTALLLLPALNEMFDVTTSRKVALFTHLPALIFVLLITVALFSGLLAGYAMAKRHSRSWLHILVYALAIAITTYAIVDLDFPRSGLIRLDAADDALAKLRESMQ